MLRNIFRCEQCKQLYDSRTDIESSSKPEGKMGTTTRRHLKIDALHEKWICSVIIKHKMY